MPVSLIEVRRTYSADEERAILSAVHRALVDAFQVPEEDRIGRLIAHPPHRFVPPPGLAQPDRYTLVTIDGFAGRSATTKQRLFTAIVSRLEPLGIPRDHVSTIVHDVPRESWGSRGGVAASSGELDDDVRI